MKKRKKERKKELLKTSKRPCSIKKQFHSCGERSAERRLTFTSSTSSGIWGVHVMDMGYAPCGSFSGSPRREVMHDMKITVISHITSPGVGGVARSQ